MKMVNTVTGKVSSDALGATLMHEHLVFAQLGWDSDITMAPLDIADEINRCTAKLIELKKLGMDSLLNASPADANRTPAVLKAASEQSGVNVIACTGMYDEGGGSNYWKFRMPYYDITEELYDLFMTEIELGMEGTGVKAGAIKVASSNGKITPYESCVMHAAARAAKSTGVPITTHTACGTMGKEQVELFLAEGVDPNKIVIGHMCDCLDADYNADIIEKGFSVGWDRFGLEGSQYACPTDEERYPVILELIRRGYANRINLGSDSAVCQHGRPAARFWAVANKCRPEHIFMDVIPYLKSQGVTDEQVNGMLVENARFVFGS